MTRLPNANTDGLPPHPTFGPTFGPTLGTRVRKTAQLLAVLGLLGWLLVSARIPCAFAQIFHTPCPGCGSTRAMLALAHGDLHAYLHFNPLAPLMSLILAVLFASSVYSVFKTGSYQGVAAGRLGIFLARGAAVVAVAQAVLWIARFAGFLGGPVPV